MLKNHTLCLLALMFPLCLSGCPVVLVGSAAAGAAMYSSGELKTTRNVTLNQSYFAAVRALEDLGVVIVTQEKDGLNGLVIGRGTEEKKIRVSLKKLFDDVTEIRIRIGWLGDELQSRLVFSKMEHYMTAPPVPQGDVVAPVFR
jgi:hypothetical protein